MTSLSARSTLYCSGVPTIEGNEEEEEIRGSERKGVRNAKLNCSPQPISTNPSRTTLILRECYKGIERASERHTLIRLQRNSLSPSMLRTATSDKNRRPVPLSFICHVWEHQSVKRLDGSHLLLLASAFSTNRTPPTHSASGPSARSLSGTTSQLSNTTEVSKETQCVGAVQWIRQQRALRLIQRAQQPKYTWLQNRVVLLAFQMITRIDCHKAHRREDSISLRIVKRKRHFRNLKVAVWSIKSLEITTEQSMQSGRRERRCERIQHQSSLTEGCLSSPHEQEGESSSRRWHVLLVCALVMVSSASRQSSAMLRIYRYFVHFRSTLSAIPFPPYWLIVPV